MSDLSKAVADKSGMQVSLLPKLSPFYLDYDLCASLIRFVGSTADSD